MSHRPRRRPMILALAFTGTAVIAGCATLFGARGKDCPNGADLIVNNRSHEAVEVIMIHMSNERTLGLAGAGRSVMGLPEGVGRDARFKSRPARGRPGANQEFGDPPFRGNVSFQVMCRHGSGTAPVPGAISGGARG